MRMSRFGDVDIICEPTAVATRERPTPILVFQDATSRLRIFVRSCYLPFPYLVLYWYMHRHRGIGSNVISWFPEDINHPSTFALALTRSCEETK